MAYQKKLHDLHPGWEYRFYDENDCKKIVERYSPSFLPVYNSCATNIQRVDIFRFIAVYSIGGFYLDLDIECFNHLNILCEYYCVFGEEVTITKLKDWRLDNRATNLSYAIRLMQIESTLLNDLSII